MVDRVTSKPRETASDLRRQDWFSTPGEAGDREHRHSESAGIWYGRQLDQKRERLGHRAIPLFVCAAGRVACMVFAMSLVLATQALCFTLLGVYAVQEPFWATATEMLPAAAGVAAIASINDLAGSVEPLPTDWTSDATGGSILRPPPLIIPAVATE